jgi:hypothetical protein
MLHTWPICDCFTAKAQSRVNLMTVDDMKNDPGEGLVGENRLIQNKRRIAVKPQLSEIWCIV